MARRRSIDKILTKSVTATVIALVAALVAAVLLSWLWHRPLPPLPGLEEKEAPRVKWRLTEVDTAEFLASLLPSARKALLEPDPYSIEALNASKAWLQKIPSDRSFPLPDGTHVTASHILQTLEAFESLWEKRRSRETEALQRRFAQLFVVLRLEAPAKIEGGPVLVTGYYQPEAEGSLEKKGDFEYPLYGVPEDLVSVSLRRFDPRLPARTLFGRVEQGRLIPYFTRKEIESLGLLPDSLALCWLQSPVDALEIQIQGSAIIRLEDGSARFIHYAADNGQPYGSIGKWLIDQGYLPAEGLDWPAIERWAERHPDLFVKALEANPRYIFFKWEEDGPIGGLGFKLTPGRSAALDPDFFPPVLPFLLQVPLPKGAEELDWTGLGVEGEGLMASLLLFGHDRGAAIKGPGRLDLYCGSGAAAGAVAGRLKHRGTIHLILSRKGAAEPMRR